MFAQFLLNETRTDKLLSIFSVVQFKNSECEADGSIGLCLTVTEVWMNNQIWTMNDHDIYNCYILFVILGYNFVNLVLLFSAQKWVVAPTQKYARLGG